MGFEKKAFFFVVAINSAWAMEKPKSVVLFDLNALITHDPTKIQEKMEKILAKKGFSLTSAALSAFGLVDSFRVLFNPDLGQEKFFKFLAPLAVDDELSDSTDVVSVAASSQERVGARYHGMRLLLNFEKWVFGMPGFDSATVEESIARYVDTQEISPAAKAFYLALTHVTVDPDIMEKTCVVNEETRALAQSLRNLKVATILIGHCNPASLERLQKSDQKLFDLFSGYLFSSQLPKIRPDTVFEEDFWMHALGLMPEKYAYVEDGTMGKLRNGKVVKLPHHYTSSPCDVERLMQDLGLKK